MPEGVEIPKPVIPQIEIKGKPTFDMPYAASIDPEKLAKIAKTYPNWTSEKIAKSRFIIDSDKPKYTGEESVELWRKNGNKNEGLEDLNPSRIRNEDGSFYINLPTWYTGYVDPIISRHEKNAAGLGILNASLLSALSDPRISENPAHIEGGSADPKIPSRETLLKDLIARKLDNYLNGTDGYESGAFNWPTLDCVTVDLVTPDDPAKTI